jgi:UDPglucose--hexose-1-phosphate uridylyltransferase
MGCVTCGEGPDAAVGRDASDLVDYAIGRGLVDELDRRWAYNVVLAAVGATGPAPRPAPTKADAGRAAGEPFDLQRTLGRLAAFAVGHGRGATGHDPDPGGPADAPAPDELDAAACAVMGALMPRPSQVAARFRELLATGDARRATDYFYRLCCDADYVRRAAIARDVRWVTPTRWGDLQITINLSKPEKDPRAIARAAAPAARAGGAAPYPACALCRENEGYAGRGPLAEGGAHPARQNLRVVPLELGGQGWGMQYSPYAYFPEHCIVMSDRHEPMRVDRDCLVRLLDFVDLLPHYFVGSNAGLPIVGGSILSHEHFQGGRHTFLMDLAPVDCAFAMPGFPGVRAGVLRWPLTVIRLRGGDREELVSAGAHVMDAWAEWDDPSVGIVSHDPDGTPHNAVTPIVRRASSLPGASPAGAPAPGRGEGADQRDDGRDGYVLSLALRSNLTSACHPLGVFHPHEELHHIKRENIGLIEVMGLAILPGRLRRELTAVVDGLLAGTDLSADPLTAPHAAWAAQVAARHPDLSPDDARAVMRDEVGQVFARVLEQAGVFKWDEPGRAALGRFVDSL